MVAMNGQHSPVCIDTMLRCHYGGKLRMSAISVVESIQRLLREGMIEPEDPPLKAGWAKDGTRFRATTSGNNWVDTICRTALPMEPPPPWKPNDVVHTFTAKPLRLPNFARPGIGYILLKPTGEFLTAEGWEEFARGL